MNKSVAIKINRTMAFECLVPFLVASSFQNLHLAELGDIGLGVNEDMLFLGAGFDLEPCDLVNIVHDKANTLNRHKIIELLNAGVINIDYISNFDRLCDLGFTITELLILLNKVRYQKHSEGDLHVLKAATRSWP